MCALFTTYTRLADTFRFDVPPKAAFEFSAKMLLSKAGYTFPPPLVWLTPK